MMCARYSLLSIVLAIVLIAGGSDAIIGGERALQGEFPYMVSLQTDGEHFCGAAIVDKRHLVTAAQCATVLRRPYNGDIVETGSVDKDDGEIHYIKSITIHPQFNKTVYGSKYDIAIIVLTKNIIFNDNQKSVALSNGPFPNGATATVIGFGVTNKSDDTSSHYLNKVNTVIMSYEECDDDDYTRFCTSFLHRTGPCHLDLGGPLVYDGHLLGIVWFPYGCGKFSHVGGFTNVSHFVPWIRESMAPTYALEDPFEDVDSDNHALQNIIDNVAAKVAEFPYIVSMRKNGKHACGGVIVDERHVVTTAHCVQFLSSPYENTVIVTGSIWKDDGQIHRIERITSHVQYDESATSPYDIAIIALKGNIIFNDNQTSVELSQRATPGGVIATMVGWRFTIPKIRTTFDYLQKMNTTILDHKTCMELAAHPNRIREGYHICAISSPVFGACRGDRGGPLVYDGHLIGIDSFGYHCANRFPTVYVNVSHYVPWIQEQIRATYKLEADLHAGFQISSTHLQNVLEAESALEKISSVEEIKP